MDPKAIDAVIGIPELTTLISQHLAPYGIAQCLLVCKAWTRQFHPHIWTNFRAGKILPQDTTALHQSLHRIRTVDISGNYNEFIKLLANGLPPVQSPIQTRPDSALARCMENSALQSDKARLTKAKAPLCTNLKRLKLSSYNLFSHDSNSTYVEMLLNHNSNLTHVNLELIPLCDTNIIPSISQLHRLQHLSLRGQYSGPSSIYLLLKCCLPLPQLTELHLDIVLELPDGSFGASPWSSSNLEAMLVEASAARFSGCSTVGRIKALTLPALHEEDEYPIPVLPFLKSDIFDLESCTIPWFPVDTDIAGIQQMVKELCPRLKHLTCPSYFETNQDGQAACAFIQGCSGLLSFRSKGFSDSDTDDYEDFPPREIISALFGRHSETLEEVELLDCLQVFSGDLGCLLSRCKQLKRLWVFPCERGKAGLEFDDACRRDWVCMGLKELGLTLNRYSSEDSFGELDEPDDESDLDEDQEEQLMRLSKIAAKRIYGQIGQLEKLEVLALEADVSEETLAKECEFDWDLTLSKGWLAELSGLKNLRHLQMRSNFWGKMGQAEVEFMHAQWPLLSEVSFSTWSTTIPSLIEQPHWQWLKQQRPHLRYSRC
ncbi:hypothetical protein BGX28_008474 [Mortierella sp. GBA30]|nr:hypothetical protein BGX28_008474 [Mortierella sp. GBA30]